jgi:hypothetical protein
MATNHRIHIMRLGGLMPSDLDQSGKRPVARAQGDRSVRTQSTWFVSFEVPRDAKRRTFARVTETFASEGDAKQFAKAKLSLGQTVSAGTINPYQPKRTVTPMRVSEWIDEPEGSF